MKPLHMLGLLAISLMFCTSPAKAIATLATADCGEWVLMKDPSGKPTREFRYWLLGYLSGAAVETGKDILRTTSSASIELWMDNYCKANPLKTVGEGATTLFYELTKKTKSN